MMKTVAELKRERARVEKLLYAADLRQHQSWDKAPAAQDRIDATCRKHRRSLVRIDAQLDEAESASS